MRRRLAAGWALVLLAAALCEPVAGKGGRGGARGAARGAARGRAKATRYGSALRVAAGAAAAGAALRRAGFHGRPEPGESVERRDGNWTGGAWTSAAAATEPGWAVPWLWPLAATLRR
ncbi:shadow of prion protein [Cuculus canorus]|uniref:shadow of prion protein n=1 Tax=Cuculus canorus TaxID=55661 RepID=UPI0023AAFED2|nr:shadow of prion protein [Cuculus canorus]